MWLGYSTTRQSCSLAPAPVKVKVHLAVTRRGTRYRHTHTKHTKQGLSYHQHNLYLFVLGACANSFARRSSQRWHMSRARATYVPGLESSFSGLRRSYCPEYSCCGKRDERRAGKAAAVEIKLQERERFAMITPET